MTNMLNRFLWVYLFAIPIMASCVTGKGDCQDSLGKSEWAILAINNFVDSNSELLVDSTFSVRVKLLDNKVVGISLYGYNQPFLINKINANTYQKQLPSKAIEVGDKLFYWKVDSIETSEDVLAKLKNYSMLQVDTSDTRRISHHKVDDGKKSRHYYFCSCDKDKFVTLEVNYAMGYGEKPKLKCP